MSGVGPVEPGEGTRAWDTADHTDNPDTLNTPFGADAMDSGEPNPPPPPRRSVTRLTHWYARHRRAALSSVLVAALFAGSGYLYATRPQKPAPPAAPYPSQVVDVTYLEEVATPKGVQPRSFSFAVELSVLSGPPVTVTRIFQPYAGLSLTSAPRAPFRTKAGSSRTVVITMHVTDCRKAPESAGLPFLDVTLRNTRAIQDHSFILGPRYAQNLSAALQVACSNDSR